MSFFNLEKLQDAQNANLDLLQQISGKIFSSVEQLSQLQFKT
ncbi:MAG: phasin family protein, partial [Pseudomonas sp.]